MRFDADDTFPGNAPSMLPGGEPFKQAAGSASERGDNALFAMHVVHAAEALAVEGANPLIPKVGEPHHSAPWRGSHLPAAASLF